jgi:hypothetical protein
MRSLFKVEFPEMQKRKLQESNSSKEEDKNKSFSQVNSTHI